ncbi:MAG TPA: hypothetical protein VM935_17615 [Chitinophagaceae bacterium]|nr:hypothetical protein [Chitinophagaceae bacterium]
MSDSFPMQYTLANGTEVVVNKTEGNSYHFTLTPTEGNKEDFTYVDDGRPKSEWDESLEFEQLDALRTFWLKADEV